MPANCPRCTTQGSSAAGRTSREKAQRPQELCLSQGFVFFGPFCGDFCNRLSEFGFVRLCLAASVLLSPRPAPAQEAIRNEQSTEAAAMQPRLHPDATPYTVKSGDFRLLATPSLALNWNDNVRLSHDNPEDDLILLPTMALVASYPLTQRNLLQLNVAFGYQKYVQHDDLSTWYVQSGSALSFDVAFGDFLVNLHDQFSYVQDAAQQAAIANTGSYGLLNNTAGALATWNLNQVTLSLGYDHQLVKSTASQFEQQDHTSELVTTRAGLRVHPTVTTGVEGTASLTTYNQLFLNDNNSYSGGVYADWQPDTSFHLEARGGYSTFIFQHNSPFVQTSDLNSWYVGLTATHQISQGVSYTLSAGHDISLGIQADAIEEWYFTPTINWSIIRNWTFTTGLSYQHGDQGLGNQGGNLTETFDWLGATMSVSHAITSRINAALNYRFTVRGSSIAMREYTQNLVGLQLTYVMP